MKEYIKPQLVEYGKVEELTQSTYPNGTPDQVFYQTSGTQNPGSAQNS